MSENPHNPHKANWGRRIGIGIVAFLCIALIAHATWRYTARRKLQVAIANLRSAGEPMILSDLLPAIPDGSDNGVADLSAAFETLNPDAEPFRTFDSLAPALPLTAAERDAIEQALADRTAALAAIDAAATKSRFDWYVDPRTSAINWMLPNFNVFRKHAQLLVAGALLDHENGDELAAIHKLQNTMVVSRAAGTYPSIVGNLVGVGCAALCADHAMKIAPTLKASSGHAARDLATRDALKKLIATLLDDVPTRQSYRRGLQGERVLQQQLLAEVLKGAPVSMTLATAAGSPSSNAPSRWSPLAIYFGRPIVDANSRFLIDYTGSFMTSFDASNYRAALAARPPVPPEVQNKSMMYTLAFILKVDYFRCAEANYRCMTDRRLAAVTLAIGWYASDHDGQIPASLSDLVPDYLPRVPTDPMAAGDAPLGYRRDTAVVYSVGLNGTDEHGSETVVPKSPGSDQRWRTEDRVVHLTPRPRSDDDR